MAKPKGTVRIAMIAKYIDSGSFKLADSYVSISEALKLLPEISADLAIVDVEMPGMGGLEAVRQIVADHRIPIGLGVEQGIHGQQGLSIHLGK